MCERLGLRSEAARVLQWVGGARFSLGDLRGLDDMREALRRSLQPDVDPFVTATSYNNLSETLGGIDGPREALELRRAGIEFAERRGLAGMAYHMRAAAVNYLDELGRWDEALAAADAALAWEHSGQIADIALSCKAHMLSLRGKASEASELIERALPLAREIGDSQTLGPTLAVTALTEQLAGNVQGAVVHALEHAEVTRSDPGDRSILEVFTEIMRVLIAAGMLNEAEAYVEEGAGLAVGVRQENSLRTGKALLAESKRDFGEALELYDYLVERWATFGNVLEHAHALFGAGRCLVQLGDASKARGRLDSARAIFAELGARPLLDETDSWLSGAMASPR